MGQCQGARAPVKPGRPSDVRPGPLWSPPFPLPAPLVVEGRALAGLAPNAHGRLAVGLCSIPGVAGKAVALWQPSASHGLQSIALNTLPGAQGPLQLPAQPWEHSPASPSPGFCPDDFSFSFLLLASLFLSPEAINCLMRAIEIYTDMVRVAACPVPPPAPPYCSSLPSQLRPQEQARGGVGAAGVWSPGPAPAPPQGAPP